MIKEDYVSFEVAKMLKEKGFDECPLYRYDDCGQIWVQGGYDETIKWHFPAPTLQMAMKWLREVHNILIVVDRAKTHYYWELEDNINGNDIDGYGGCQTYEEAVEAALKYCLEKFV